jgi:hypothetical protein
MKKFFILMLFMLLVSFVFVSCDESTEGEQNASQPKVEEKTTIKGELVETEHFSVIKADGYSKMDIAGGIQLYKGSNALEIWVRGTGLDESDAEDSCVGLQKRYDGTETKKVSKFGLDFYTSTYEAVGYPQTVYITVKDGQKIQIGIVGKTHETDETLQGMFESIKIK